MRIAFDCRWFQISGLDGIGGYVLNLVKALLEIDRKNEYLLLFDRADRRRYFMDQVTNGGEKQYKNVRVKEIFPSDAVGRNILFFSKLLRDEKIDLYHSPFFLIQPLGKSYRLIITIHDLLAYRFPKYIEKACPKLRFFFVFDHLQEAILERAESIIVHGEELKRALLDKFGKLKAENIKVVWPGVEERFKRRPVAADKLAVYLKKYALPKNYILFRGKQAPHTNLTSLINAYHALSPELRKKHQLVIAGVRVGEYHARLKKLAKQLNLESRVIFPGFISRRDLPYIYQGATLFVYPTFYETYGITLIEALASGLPTICSDLPHLAALSNGAALLVNPSDIKALTQEIKKVLESPELSRELAQKAKKQGGGFSWAQTAQKTLEIYQK